MEDQEKNPVVWIKELDEPVMKTVTKEDVLYWVNRKADAEVFVNRNITSLKSEEDSQFVRAIQKYIRENLK